MNTSVMLMMIHTTLFGASAVAEAQNGVWYGLMPALWIDAAIVFVIVPRSPMSTSHTGSTDCYPRSSLRRPDISEP